MSDVQTPSPFIVMSSDNPQYDVSINVTLGTMFERQLTARGLSFTMVLGAYNGVKKISYLVPTPNEGDEYACLQLARRYGQESILHVDTNRVATLIYLRPGQGAPNILRAEPVGFWRATDKAEAEKLGNYTTDGYGAYYVTALAA